MVYLLLKYHSSLVLKDPEESSSLLCLK